MASKKEPKEKVWFDGVDKKLIECHSNPKKTKISQPDEDTFITTKCVDTIESILKKPKGNAKTKKKKKTEDNTDTNTNGESSSKSHKKSASDKALIKPHTGVTNELALDCEMVECYHHVSVLARISIVNLFGHPILDRYVAPPAKVTDYRTRWSGIRKQDLEGAPDFDTVQAEVANLIKDRIVVGHSVRNDFRVLKLTHPPHLIRDTSEYYKYLFQGKTPSLKKLTECLLGVGIQQGEHDSIQDAQATMKLYVHERSKWNKSLDKKTKAKASSKKSKGQKQKTKPKKKKVKVFFVKTD